MGQSYRFIRVYGALRFWPWWLFFCRLAHRCGIFWDAIAWSAVGIILFFGTIGGAIGPILAGMVFDYSGNYDSAFITLAVLMALGLILVLTLPKTQATAA